MGGLPAKSAILLTLAALFSINARAESNTTNDDVRCLVVAMKMASSSDQTTRSASAVLAYYYFGRVDGASPGLDLGAAIIDELSKMTPEVLQSEARRCGTELSKRGAALTAIGQDLKKQGEEQLHKSSP